MPEKIHDAAIVGSGPAGMFAGLEILTRFPEAKIIIFEKGKSRKAGSKHITFGLGGSGAFSDGKLTLTHLTGGELATSKDPEFMAEKDFYELLDYARSIYIKFGGTDDVQEPDSKIEKELLGKAQQAQLTFVPYRVHHLGTENVGGITKNIYKHLQGLGLEIKLSCLISEIVPEAGYFKLVSANGEEFFAKKVIVAPGREGEEWWVEQAKKLNLVLIDSGVDIGVRLEVSNEVLDHYTAHFHDLKFKLRSSSDDMVRTFCVCPGGYVSMEEYRGGILCVNGHSFKNPKMRTGNTNLAILVTMKFTQPFNDPIGYARYIAGLANYLSGGKVLVQRLFDLRNGRRSTPERMSYSSINPTLKEAEPGDLSLVLPERFLRNIREMIDALAIVAPGIGKGDTLIYGVEVKFYSKKTKVTKDFETQIPGLYIIGDGSGYIRGLIQSSMSGVVAGRDVVAKFSSGQKPPELPPEQE